MMKTKKMRYLYDYLDLCSYCMKTIKLLKQEHESCQTTLSAVDVPDPSILDYEHEDGKILKSEMVGDLNFFCQILFGGRDDRFATSAPVSLDSIRAATKSITPDPLAIDDMRNPENEVTLEGNQIRFTMYSCKINCITKTEQLFLQSQNHITSPHLIVIGDDDEKGKYFTIKYFIQSFPPGCFLCDNFRDTVNQEVIVIGHVHNKELIQDVPGPNGKDMITCGLFRNMEPICAITMDMQQHLHFHEQNPIAPVMEFPIKDMLIRKTTNANSNVDMEILQSQLQTQCTKRRKNQKRKQNLNNDKSTPGDTKPQTKMKKCKISNVEVK